jgi:hypothetical protein
MVVDGGPCLFVWKDDGADSSDVFKGVVAKKPSANTHLILGLDRLGAVGTFYSFQQRNQRKVDLPSGGIPEATYMQEHHRYPILLSAPFESVKSS